MSFKYYIYRGGFEGGHHLVENKILKKKQIALVETVHIPMLQGSWNKL